jgi:hypothetical protein
VTFNDSEISWTNEDDLPQPEPRGFTPEQMIVCDACLRVNPPTRAHCMYCAAALPATTETLALRQPTLRHLEHWERGYNCILLPASLAASPSEEEIAEAARLVRLDSDTLKSILKAAAPLPLARAATLEDALLIKNRLGALQGFDVLIASDVELGLNNATKSVRALDFTDEALILHLMGGETQRILWPDVSLLVVGRLFVRRIEVEERARRGKPENEIVDAREFDADEALLDLYIARDANNCDAWRIGSSNFDFSCLGANKSLLATENFRALNAALRERARDAQFSDSYHGARRFLNFVWPLEQRTKSRGWQRSRPGRYSTQATIMSDNEKQFTLYSRLQNYLKMRSESAP